MVELSLLAVGVAAGLVIGRWWALLASLGFAVWVFQGSVVDEVPAWFLALGYGTLSAVGITAGVLMRRSLR